MREIQRQLQELEERLLSPDVRRNAAVVSSLLADDFREFGTSGKAYSRQEVIDGIQSESPVEFLASEFEATMLAEDTALLTYRSIKHDRATGDSVNSLRSSIWVLRGGRWQMLFHQGTRAADV
jgi:hypothetical protein